MTYTKPQKISEPHVDFPSNMGYLKKWLERVLKWDPTLIKEFSTPCIVSKREKRCWDWDVTANSGILAISFYLHRTYLNLRDKKQHIYEKDMGFSSSFPISVHQSSENFRSELDQRMRQLFDHGYIWKDKKSPSAQKRDHEQNIFSSFTP